jgi:hypothetical protein
VTIKSGIVSAEFFSKGSDCTSSKSEVLGSGLLPSPEWVTYSYPATTGDDVSGGVTLQLKAECPAGKSCEVNTYFDDVTIKTNGVELATNGGFETGTTDGWLDNIDFHVYAVEWDPGRITYSVDGEVYHIIRSYQVSGDWVFNNEFFMLLNLAVGGTVGGAIGPDIFPADLLVDYVRIFERAQ